MFNLVPGYPLDGGRILPSILWGLLGDGDRATRIAAGTGMVVAMLLIFGGMIRSLGGAGVGGRWLAFIGGFLLDAARSSFAEVTVLKALRDIRTGDIMTDQCETISATTHVDAFVQQLLRSGRRYFIVTRDDGGIAGLITPQDLRGIDRNQWPEVYVTDAMRPLRDLKTVEPSTPVTYALRIMSREDLNQLPVMAGGRLAVVLTRGQVLRFMQTRLDLKV